MSEPPRAPVGEVARRAFAGRTVLVTGHSGFVGGWLTLWLHHAGARVVGLALPPVDADANWAGGRHLAASEEGDVSDAAAVDAVVDRYRPDAVFHLAAQALVLESYADPLGTLRTNVLGTATVLDALRRCGRPTPCVVVTSDKCYADWRSPRTEADALGGNDPYSASKAAAEIVAHAYSRSFLGAGGVATARAGNIVGGGDRGAHRIVPDFVRSAAGGPPLRLRHPGAVRPWQHACDAVAGYLLLGAALTDDPLRFSRPWNFGPPTGEHATVAEVVDRLARGWTRRGGAPVAVFPGEAAGPFEEPWLSLDCARSRTELAWTPRLDWAAAIEWALDWYWPSEHAAGFDPATVALQQIARYEALDAERATTAGVDGPSLALAAGA